MNKRSEVKGKHELICITTFIDEINRRHRSVYKVIDTPDPPDAIIQSNNKTTWVEVVTAHMSKAFAKDIWSFATPAETHHPMMCNVMVGPDTDFVQVVRKKNDLASYEAIRDKYGAGYLVVSVQYPHFKDNTLKVMRKLWNATTFADKGCFRSIYLIVRCYKGYVVVLWWYK